MSKLLTLHIGMPKTGSSTIQNFAAAHRARLLELGIDYPDWARFDSTYGTPRHRSTGNANPLVYAILTQCGALPPCASFDPDEALQTVLDAVAQSPAGHLVLSHEDLVSLSAEALQAFIAAVRARGAETRAILYVREQADWLASDYQQQIKQLRATADLHTHVGRRLDAVNYMSICNRWAALVGPAGLTVRLLSRRTIAHNLAFDFFSSIGHAIEEFKTVDLPNANEGLSAAGTAFLLAANRSGAQGEAYKKLYGAAHQLVEPGGGKFQLPPDLAALVRAFHARGNREFAIRYLNPQDAEALLDAGAE